jgi:hypothetical protein
VRPGETATAGAPPAGGVATAAELWAGVDAPTGACSGGAAAADTTETTGDDAPAICGGGAGRNTAGGDGDADDRAAAGVAFDVEVRAADGGATRELGAVGAYAIRARGGVTGLAYAAGVRPTIGCANVVGCM